MTGTQGQRALYFYHKGTASSWEVKFFELYAGSDQKNKARLSMSFSDYCKAFDDWFSEGEKVFKKWGFE